MPSAAALVSAAQEHFAFFSAAEGDPEQEEEEEPMEELASGSQDLGPRVENLEKAMVGMQQGIDQLFCLLQMEKMVPQDDADPKRKPALKKAGTPSPSARVSFAPSLGASAKQKAMNPPLSLTLFGPYGGAGSYEGRGGQAEPSRDGKPDCQEPKRPEGEGDKPHAGDRPLVGGRGRRCWVARSPFRSWRSFAISRPCRFGIVEAHCLGGPAGRGQEEEEFADQAGCCPRFSVGSHFRFIGLGLGKKTAAARRALRQTFKEHPEEIHQLLEKLMYEDLLCTTVGPNMATPSLNARAWVEFRSHIGNFKTSAHAAWSAAGIADALRNGDHHRARAMSLLLLLQLDQTAIDKGSWSFSSDLSLEPLPPFGSLSQHQGPSVQDGEQPFSKLLDERWSTITMSHLRDQDDFIQRRRNVGKIAKAATEDKEEPDPKRRPKPKPKPKAGATPQQDA